jgi:hypothetical protein
MRGLRHHNDGPWHELASAGMPAIGNWIKLVPGAGVEAATFSLQNPPSPITMKNR